MSMQNEDLLETLRNLANQFPKDMEEVQIRDIARIAFNIGLVLNATKPKSQNALEICDLCGGLALFSIGCAAYGFKRTVLVDDFNDPINHRVGSSLLDLHRRLGVEIVQRDVVQNGIHDIEGNFDVITTFESMEHWHHSPKRLFHEVVAKLKPDGLFVLSAPNCVNLRKRITVPFGAGKWTGMQEWYDADLFRGHVREPDVNDLMHIAHDMGLADIKIYGRNWLGYDSPNGVIRFATKILDYPLRLKPSFCSNIYLVGKKAQRADARDGSSVDSESPGEPGRAPATLLSSRWGSTCTSCCS